MDVTLERVQFKFASIIGELCSKPLILSQFAVWVDLRLSEYKLKGAISLDCSGDKPDPDWLKGIKTVVGLEVERLSSQSVRDRNHESSRTSRDISDKSSRGLDDTETEALELRNSPNVSIKQEMDEEGIYPVGLHMHQAEYRDRKRSHTSAGLSQSEASPYSQSPLKMRKSTDYPDTDTLQESNQSLMSIIGSDNDDPSLTVEEAQNNIDMALAASIQDNVHHQTGADNSLTSSYTPVRSSQPSSTVIKSSLYPFDSTPSPSTSKSDVPKPAPSRMTRQLPGTHIRESVSGGDDGALHPESIIPGKDDGALHPESIIPAVHIKQEPDDEGAFEFETFQSTRDLPDNPNRTLEIPHTTTPASLLLQRLVKKEAPIEMFTASCSTGGHASQTLLSLLEKGKECPPVSESQTHVSSSRISGTTLAALLSRVQHAGGDTLTTNRSSLQPCSTQSSQKPPTYGDMESSGMDSKGPTRLRRLLQGEDIASPASEPWKKKCEDLESARTALKYFINRIKMGEHTGPLHDAKLTDMDESIDFQLKCMFCNYSNEGHLENNFILHMFSHANNGDLKHFDGMCPECNVIGLPYTEFVCHAFSHCIVPYTDKRGGTH